jgi:phosphate/sulfate permease
VELRFIIRPSGCDLVSVAALENLRRDTELRSQTDRRISTAWVLLPIVAFLLAISVSVVYGLAVLSASSTVSTILGGFILIAGVGLASEVLFLYFFYMLIRRRNQHFLRQQRLFSDLVTTLRAVAIKKSMNIDPMLGSIDNTLRQTQAEETEKSAVLWVLLMLVPLVSIVAMLYVLYFLTTDFPKHERREDGMLSDVERALALTGVQFIFHRNDPIPQRSFALYLIITIITVGIFGLYWEYVLIKDPNNHFANHAAYEPQLIQLFAPLVG